ncbi:MAG: permease-like cell division protein FtsX [Pseudomonadales bacterium]|nr:permease-like cell division protein FtsX [Pseudomonadales bacterium]
MKPANKGAAPRRGASVAKTQFSHRFESYKNNHKEVAASSLQRLLSTPLPTLMTVMVIAIALALPVGLYVMLKNAQALSRDWDGSAQISLYLKLSTTERQGKELATRLAKRVDIGKSQYISKEQALEEFKALSGFGDVLTELEDNPLPAVIVVYPTSRDLAKAEVLQQELNEFREVDTAQLDAQWVRRLHAMLDLAERIVWALGLGLSLAVLLVIINTIRLAIESRRDEIVIVKLVGGTDGFVQRPFLYTGLWYGLGGGIIALLVIQSVLFWVDSPVAKLADLYSSAFNLRGLGFGPTLALLLGSGGLGWLGAWWAVRQHLRAIEPR